MLVGHDAAPTRSSARPVGRAWYDFGLPVFSVGCRKERDWNLELVGDGSLTIEYLGFQGITPSAQAELG